MLETYDKDEPIKFKKHAIITAVITVSLIALLSFYEIIPLYIGAFMILAIIIVTPITYIKYTNIFYRQKLSHAQKAKLKQEQSKAKLPHELQEKLDSRN